MEHIFNSMRSWLANASMERALTLLIGIALVFLLTSFLKKGVRRSVQDADSRYRVQKGLNFLGYLLAAVIVLLVYGDHLGNLGVALGVAGAGIAFALQEVIVSLAGWFNIILSGNPSVGDRVKIGDVKGDIIDIGVMTTTVMEIGDWVNGDLYNGRIVRVANSYVFKEHIHNYSSAFPFLWDEVTVPIRTESDHHLAREVFSKVLNDITADYSKESEAKWNALAGRFKIEQAKVLPMIAMRFDENWITFTLRYIVDYRSRRSMQDRIYTALLNEIDKHDGIIMIATSSMEIITTSDKDLPDPEVGTASGE